RANGGVRQWMWMSVGGGDGFQNQIDPTDFNIFYTESQNAGINRYDLTIGETRSIKPNAGGGGRGGGGGGGGRGGAGAAVDPNVEAAPVPAAGGGRANIINPLPGATFGS